MWLFGSKRSHGRSIPVVHQVDNGVIIKTPKAFQRGFYTSIVVAESVVNLVICRSLWFNNQSLRDESVTYHNACKSQSTNWETKIIEDRLLCATEVTGKRM